MAELFNEYFVNVLFCFLLAVITVLGGKIVTSVLPYIKAKIQSTQYSWAYDIIEKTVRAYEQMYCNSHGIGSHKYDLVVSQVTAELNKIGIGLTDQQISTLIEAAVQVMNSEKFPVEDTTEAADERDEQDSNK